MSLQRKTMDVGAKAGFYTEKSPKMLLHEWCIQKKRPTPRYRITAAEEGEEISKAKVQNVAAACPFSFAQGIVVVSPALIRLMKGAICRW